MKKTRSRKSRDTVSVRQSTTQLPAHQNSLMAARANGLYAQHFIQSTSVDSCRQCKMWLKPENRKDPLTMIYVTY
jgi:hypothetical protein